MDFNSLLAAASLLAQNPLGYADDYTPPGSVWLLVGVGIVIWVLIKLESDDKND